MTKFSIPEMTCGHCKKTVEEAIHRLDGDARIEVDLEKHVIEVATVAGSDQMIASLKDAGYDASPI